jgi:IMP dehydrogenase/GMP reductase
MLDILGGIRSACAYVGADSLKDLPKCAEFIRVNRTHFDKTL